jgi:MFS family permease
MGIGLVDPILPSISSKLNASPSETTLLFIATSLAVIVASASGGFAGAIVLYETALGLGIAVGPLLGGTLGTVSWRGPFYGVSVLMAIALIATVVLVEKTPVPAKKTSLAAPLLALRHRGLLTRVNNTVTTQATPTRTGGDTGG